MKDWTRKDRRHREALEKASPSAPRLNAAGFVNGLASSHEQREMPGLAAIGTLRLAQSGHAQAVRARNNRHDRWFAGLFGKASDDGRKDGLGGGPDSAANEEFVPELRAARVRDAGGAMHGAASNRDGVNDGSDHWSSGEVSDAMSTLSIEDYRHMMARRVRSRFW